MLCAVRQAAGHWLCHSPGVHEQHVWQWVWTWHGDADRIVESSSEFYTVDHTQLGNELAVGFFIAVAVASVTRDVSDAVTSWFLSSNLFVYIFLFFRVVYFVSNFVKDTSSSSFGCLLEAGPWLPSLLSYFPHWSVLSLPLQRSIVLPVCQIVEHLHSFPSSCWSSLHSSFKNFL